MKSIAIILLMWGSLAQAEVLKTEFTVTSQKNQDYIVQVMVTGISVSEADKIRAIVDETITKAASQFSKAGFLSNRELVIRRLNKSLTRQKVSFDGIGIIGLIKKDDKIVDVE
jgi:hypothetical protein